MLTIFLYMIIYFLLKQLSIFCLTLYAFGLILLHLPQIKLRIYLLLLIKLIHVINRWHILEIIIILLKKFYYYPHYCIKFYLKKLLLLSHTNFWRSILSNRTLRICSIVTLNSKIFFLNIDSWIILIF